MSKLSKRAILTFIVIATLLTVMIPIMPASAEIILADVTLTTIGDGTAEWTDTIPDTAGHGTLGLSTPNVVKLTMPTVGAVDDDCAGVKVYYGKDLSTITDPSDFTFHAYTALAHTPYGIFYMDTTGDGEVDRLLVSAASYIDQTTFILPENEWVEVEWFAGAPGWKEQLYDPDTGVRSARVLPWAPLADWKTLYPTAKIIYVAAEITWRSDTALNPFYIEDFTIDGDTYLIDQIEMGEGFTIDFVTGGDVVYDQVLTVIGSGVTSGSTVNVYWDYVTAANLLSVTTGKPSGEFECEVDVPSAVYGNHYLWVKDLASGISVRSDAIFVVPKITLSPSSGLKYDDITIKGYGFSDDSEITFTYEEKISGKLSDDIGKDETDELGYFEYTFEVSDVDYGDYLVTATDATHSAEATFTVGAAISLDKTVGPAGTIVKVDGRGFTGDLSTIYYGDNITLGTYLVSTKDGNNITISGGKFTAYVVVPSVPEGDYKFTFTNYDGTTGKTAVSETFEVDGETSITVTPSYGTPGTVLTVKGYNFTRISGTDVELALRDQEAEATTDASGSFTATIIIPPLDFGVTYPVTANDTRFCHAEDNVLVALMVLQLSEYSAPVGAKVMLMGSGLTKDGWWNATFGDIDLIEDRQTSGDTTYFSADFWVPSVPSGTYTIGVYDVKRKITVNIDFTVTDQAALSVSRAAIPNKYNLTLGGINFVEEAGKDTQWWIFNSTDAWDLNLETNVTYGEVVPKTDKDGEFTGYYKIPEFLELGSYTINCTTISNSAVDPDVTQYAEVDIELVPEELVINVGGPSYARGQTITFVIKTTLKKDDFKLGIKDPEGSEVFNSTWLTADWKTLGSWFYIPSNLQIDDNTQWLYTLPADATPGTWTYSFWDENKEYANGTFQVTYLTELEQLQQDIGEVMAGIEGMETSNTELAELVADIGDASADASAAAANAAAAAAAAKAAADGAAAAISDVEDVASDALDAANDAKSAADASKAAADAGLAAANAAQATSQAAADAAQDAADAAEANQKSTSGLTTLVYGAIGASLIAALAAIVSLMQISRRIAG